MAVCVFLECEQPMTIKHFSLNLLLLAFLSTALGACSLGACPSNQVVKAAAEIEERLTPLTDFHAPEDLSIVQMETLEARLTAIWEIQVPPSMQDAANTLGAAMEALKTHRVEGQSESFLNHVADAEGFLSNYLQEVGRINRCVPFCAPTTYNEKRRNPCQNFGSDS
jgi:hypothetical protein